LLRRRLPDLDPDGLVDAGDAAADDDRRGDHRAVRRPVDGRRGVAAADNLPRRVLAGADPGQVQYGRDAVPAGGVAVPDRHPGLAAADEREITRSISVKPRYPVVKLSAVRPASRCHGWWPPER
jgi:hypothetical protein